MIHIHASGVLLSTPQSRTSAKGSSYVTGMLKSTSKDGDAVVSFIAFSESAQQELQALAAGDAVTVTGNGKLTQWTAKDGIERHGLSVVADRVLAHAPPTSKTSGSAGRSPPRRSPPRPAPIAPAADEFDDAIPF